MKKCCEVLKQHFPQHCIQRKSVAEENGRKLELSKSKNFCWLRVDGCWLEDPSFKKCDFIMFCCETKKAYLTELKGKKLELAGEQIAETYRRLPHEVKKSFDFTGYIIASRIPKQHTGFNRLKDRIKRDLGLTIKQKTRVAKIS